MNKGAFFLWGALIILIVLFPFAKGEFTYHNNSIKTVYTAGENIKGGINLSFSNEPSTSLFTSNFPGQITLAEILKSSLLAEEEDYNCTVRGCNNDFVAKDLLPYSFALNSNERKMIGLNVSGEEANIQSVKIAFTSDAPTSCFGQTGIDVLDNSSYEFTNTNYIEEKCGVRNQGCFNENSAAEIAELTGNINSPYCERITLPAAPAYKLGAKIYNSTKGYAEITEELYSLDWNLLGSCKLPRHKSHLEELTCILDTPHSSQGDYLVCISVASGAQTNYTISTEQQSPVCGNAERGASEYTRDYNIFAEALSYGTIEMELNSSTFSKTTGKNLLTTLNGYLETIYKNNCKNGCTIPLTLLGGVGQTVNLQSVEFKYNTKGALITSNKLYTLERRNSTVNSGAIVLQIDKANFTIPKNSQEKTLSLFLNGARIFPVINLSIGTSFDFDVRPKSVAIGFPTLFSVILADNVSSVVWDFGDGNIKTSQGKNITYIYKDQKTFEINVKVTREKDRVISEKKFSINVANANESAIKLLSDSEKRISNISAQIRKFPSWMSKIFEEQINLSEINKTITDLKSQYSKATTDKDYVSIINGLLGIRIPITIESSLSGSGLLIEGLSTADFSYIEKLSGKPAGDKEKLKREILEWTEANYKANIDREVISSFAEGGSNPILTKFSIKLTKNNENKSKAYFILAVPKRNVYFDQEYGAREVKTDSGEGIAIEIEKNSTIIFAVKENVELYSVGAYLSPDIKELAQEFNVQPGEKAPNKTGWVILWFSLLITVFLAVYIALQEWYKKNYESHLFKNKDDIYNVITFIYNARYNGLSDEDIKNKLYQTGWRGEQINYAFKKIDGKRTGMWEIPLFKFLENRRVRKEIERRQGKPIDARFIKSQSF